MSFERRGFERRGSAGSVQVRGLRSEGAEQLGGERRGFWARLASVVVLFSYEFLVLI
jgi:hypothetical protein